MKRWVSVGLAAVSVVAAAGCKGGGSSVAGEDAASSSADGGRDGDEDGAPPSGADGMAATDARADAAANADANAAADGAAGGTGDASADGAAGVDGSIVSTGSARLCSPAGWCWLHPIPTGNDLDAILVRSATDAWFAGTFGTLLHYDGTSWSQFHVSSGYIYGLAAEASGTVWAVGSGGLAARFDGHAFTVTPTGTDVTLHGVWAAAADRAYAVGDGGTLLTWDGSAWTSTPLMMGVRAETRDLYAIWGSGPDDVWVGGNGGALWHKQGNNWGQMVGGTDAWMMIAGSAADNVWYVTGSGALYRWNGVTLTQARQAQVFMPTGLWAGSPNDVWVTRYQSVEHWDGNAWSALALGYNLGPLSGPAGNEVWGAGTAGAIARWNGRTWAPVSQSQLPYGVRQLWASGPNDVWMSSLQFLYHWDGQTVRAVASPGGHEIFGIWGSSANNVWTAGGNGEVQHWDGTQWTLAAGTSTDEFRAISGSAANDVWVVGFYSAYHYDGTAWSKRTTGIEGTALSSVFTLGPTKAWAGGFLDTLVRWDGTRWTSEPSVPITGANQAGIVAITGSGPSDVWAFGETPFHYDGQTWHAVADGPAADSAWASGPRDLWGIAGGNVFHYDGASWTDVPPDVSGPSKVWGLGPGDVLLGCEGGLLRRTGALQ